MRTRNQAELRQAVRRGIERLDERLPNWRRLFRLKEFDFQDPCRCILGTVGSLQCIDDDYSDVFQKGKLALRLERDPSYYGFDWSPGGAKEIPVLKALWCKALKGKRV